MTRGIGRREGVYWRHDGSGAGSGAFAPPFASDLIHANYPQIVTLATGVTSYPDQIASASPLDWAQLTGTKQPAYGTFTTSPALVFDGVDDFMQSPAVTLAPLSAITIAFSAFWTAAGGNAIALMDSVDPNVNPGAFYILQNGGTYTVLWRNAAANITRGGAMTAGVHRFIVVFDTVGASAIPLLYIDGVSSGAVPAASNVPFGNFAHYMGMFAGTSLPWPGKIGDVWMYGRALTVGEIASVDAALAARAT